MSDLNAVFFLSLATLGCASVGLIIKTIYKIKCNEVKCCGCIESQRDVQEEIKYDTENHSLSSSNRRSSLTLGSAARI